jgi:hypothetical protein
LRAVLAVARPYHRCVAKAPDNIEALAAFSTFSETRITDGVKGVPSKASNWRFLIYSTPRFRDLIVKVFEIAPNLIVEVVY